MRQQRRHQMRDKAHKAETAREREREKSGKRGSGRAENFYFFGFSTFLLSDVASALRSVSASRQAKWKTCPCPFIQLDMPASSCSLRHSYSGNNSKKCVAPTSGT